MVIKTVVMIALWNMIVVFKRRVIMRMAKIKASKSCFMLRKG